jgi:hypothetical protein
MSRYWQVVLILFLIGIFWIGNALAQKAGPNAVVQARCFELVDANGRVCATLGTDFRGPYLNFYENGGKIRAAMSLEKSGTPVISLTDSKGRDTRITPPEQDSSEGQGLLLMSTGWGSDKHGQRFVHGALLNNSGKPLKIAEISLNIYDVRGSLIGSAGDSIKNLEAGGTWVFKAICPHSNAASFKIKEISAR